MNTKEFLEKVADEEDLKLYINGQSNNTYCIEFEYWSGLDEDVIISLVVDNFNIEEVQHAMYVYADCFDAEEHAGELYSLHGQHSTPTSLRDLLNDADEQQEKLNSIYETMVRIGKEV